MALLALAFSCQDDLTEENVTPDPADTAIEISENDDMVTLGEQLQNPYATEVMRQAAVNIDARVSIETTHLYIKFSPKTEEELDQLMIDSTLTLFAYPLDREIEGDGSYYRDPSLPENQPVHQYTAVPVDYKLPKGVEYEVLEELYHPEEEADNGRGLAEVVIDELEDEAYRITGNLKQEEQSENSKTAIFRSRWRPAGRITYNDLVLGLVPLVGAEVRARKFTIFHKGITDANGNYSCDGRFRDRANYSIAWERYQFIIMTRGGILGVGALLDGPKMRGNWNHQINFGGRDYYRATIFRAAFHYYYQNNRGLRRPPANGIFKAKMKIAANFERNDDELGLHSSWRRFYDMPVINIWNPLTRTTDQIYSTTIHELAHASHWGMDRSDYNDTERKVKESWARGVQWSLTTQTYPNYRGGGEIRPNYTEVVLDMIDARAPLDGSGNPIDQNTGSEVLTQDDVEGYTIRQIEDAINGQKTWNGWRDNIINRYNNATEGNLPTLFAHWD